MFKTIYDTFIKAVKEKDVETVVYILQNSSIESVFKMLQDNDDTIIMENVHTKIVLEDSESIIYIDHESIEHHGGLDVVDNKVENISIHVTMPNVTQCEHLDDLINILIDDSYTCLEIEYRGKPGLYIVHVTKSGSIRTAL